MGATSTGKKSCQNWETPPKLMRAIEQRFLDGASFDVDGAADADGSNSVAPRWYSRQNPMPRFTVPERPEELPLPRWTLFCNPPFCLIPEMLDAAVCDAALHYFRLMVFLLPCSPATKWALRYMPLASIYLLAPRVNYVWPAVPRDLLGWPLQPENWPKSRSGASHESMLFVFSGYTYDHPASLERLRCCVMRWK